MGLSLVERTTTSLAPLPGERAAHFCCVVEVERKFLASLKSRHELFGIGNRGDAPLTPVAVELHY